MGVKNPIYKKEKVAERLSLFSKEEKWHEQLGSENKVWNPKKESSLEEAVTQALRQIEEKQYDAILKKKGSVSEEQRS